MGEEGLGLGFEKWWAICFSWIMGNSFQFSVPLSLVIG